jgi:ketosteroid isomerase-like protein
MNAKELLHTYLASIQNAAAAAALFADDGILELPTINERAQVPVAIQRFVNGLLARVPDFRFENVRIWIDTPDRVFGEYDAQGHVLSTGKPYKQTYAGVNCIYALNGRFEERSVHATPTMSYLSPWVSYRF